MASRSVPRVKYCSAVTLVLLHLVVKALLPSDRVSVRRMPNSDLHSAIDNVRVSQQHERTRNLHQRPNNKVL